MLGFPSSLGVPPPTSSRLRSGSDLPVCEGHGYLGPDLINVTRELRRADTQK